MNSVFNKSPEHEATFIDKELVDQVLSARLFTEEESSSVTHIVNRKRIKPHLSRKVWLVFGDFYK